MGKITSKLFDTKFGKVSMEHIEEYALADELFPEFTDNDLCVLLRIPSKNQKDFGHRAYIIIFNYIPEDYNHFTEDKWSYGGLMSEGHYTVDIINEDYSKEDYLQEEVDNSDIIYALQYLHQEDYKIIKTDI